MRRGGNPLTTANTNQGHFQTPDRAPSALKPKAATTSKKRSATPASSASALRPRKRNSLPSARDQPTLTQIDFVSTKSQSSFEQDDDDLDYIDEAPGNGAETSREVIEIDDSGDDDYQPPSRLPRGNARTVRFGSDSKRDQSKQRKTSNKDRADGKRETKNKRGKKDNKPAEKDKTLTQMDYVRRYLKIEPDDDVKLEYTYVTPKREESQRNRISNQRVPDPDHTQEPSSESKRRKLASDDVAEKKTVKTAAQDLEHQDPQLPKTPRNHRTTIPSSQSPESPGLAIISSSQFRGAQRSPLERFSPRDSHPIKEESPRHNQPEVSRQSPDLGTLPRHMSPTPVKREYSPINRPAFYRPPVHSAVGVGNAADESEKPPTATPRTVVYETDGESNYDSSECGFSGTPTLPTAHLLESDDNNETHDNHNDDDELPDIDSQYLPPIPHTELETESGLTSETNLPSDASICYQRVQSATQFPLEPIPVLDTQKMAELFPEKPHNPHSMSTASGSRPSRGIGSPIPSDPLHAQSSTQTETQTQTQTQTQSQSQTQDLEKTSTELVPESSPIAEHETRMRPNNKNPLGPRAPDTAVQVESSQPADRFTKTISQRQNPPARGILTGSQILTSSVMESVPFPAFWLGSQDSVGEPYSLPDTSG
ncbi:hypothetical protein P168DRAFT_328326 [Aspergillus campestris IBT 28561]|uniref:Uncharacterized protein n=1 Tax=Aspergillus campestris (strain IBT 28561) TaxID=1392248 RepID=A0A2I1D082_ASPC2|nr:uncharacterized protein P168DRAFT_328326 [Aspergillus campestris IBT 28561]PKY03281.1 hypothetical protein P168DRAFT_328326 [Aspergillus campestris IBT 28561]